MSSAAPSPPHRTLKADVVVVGAGPAGTAAAITLARSGRSVILLDKARFPRDKCCGDGLTASALRFLRHVGLQPSRVPSWTPVTETVIRTPRGRQGVFPLPAGGTWTATARRYELDAALVELASDAGATVLEDTALRDGHLPTAARNSAEVRLETDGPDLRCRYVVAADGMWSPTRKIFGAGDSGGYRGDWHALRQYFSHTAPSSNSLYVWFEPDLLPGYAWSFPLPDGGANVGFGFLRRPGVPVGSLNDRWNAILDRPHIKQTLGPDAKAESPAKTWPIPARIAEEPLSTAGGRVLFVGDAARASDVLTGEGIGQAFETGELAARAVAGAGPYNTLRAATAYQRVVDRGMAADDRMSRRIAAILARPGDRWMSLADFSDYTRRNFCRWMFEDYPRALLTTPHRWRWPLLRGSAPYPELSGRTPSSEDASR